MKKITLFITVIAVVLFKNDLAAQQVELVKDLNTIVNPESFINLGGSAMQLEDKVVFKAGESIYGTEPWVSDGTPEGTHVLKDITPGSESTNFGFPFKMASNNTAYFIVNTDGPLELWQTNGTEAGTIKIKDLNLRSNSNLIFFNNKYYFTGDNNDDNYEIWTTDGTDAGTFKVFEIVTDYSPGRLYIINNQLIIVYNNGSNDLRMVLSDGTIAGTSTIDIDDNVGYSFAVLGNSLIHPRQEGTSIFQTEIYSYDYLTNTDTMLADINTSGGSNPHNLITFNGHVYFNATNTNGDTFVYKTDGTPAGTNQFSSPGTPTLGDLTFAIVTSQYLYYVKNTSGQYHLHKLDGVSIETVFSHSSGFAIREHGGTFYLNTSAGLYTSDGTSSGTSLLSSSINGGVIGLTGTNELLCTNYNSTEFYNSIWTCDAITGSAIEIKNAGITTQDSNINNMKTLDDGTLIFSRYNTATSEHELWKSDGSETGTVMISDIDQIVASTIYNGNFAFIIRTDSALELWESNGTSTGTQLVKSLANITSNYGLSNLIEYNGILYFVLNDDINNTSILWQSNLTEAGTLAAIDSPVFDGTNELFVHTDGLIYFKGHEAATGYELWRTDGTLANTSIVSNIVPGLSSSSPSKFASAGNILVFSAFGIGGAGNEPHRSDGTASGTYLIDDIFNASGGNYNSNSDYYTSFNNDVYFRASNNTNTILYKTDGNTASPVNDLITSGMVINDLSATEYNGYLYFNTSDTPSGFSTQLFRTDGIATEAVGNFQYVEDFAKVADKLFVSTENGLFLIDDSVISTISLANGFEYLTPSVNRLYLSYDDPNVGHELFKVDLCNPSSIIYVDINASGKNTGYSWNDAFLSLKDAILDARNCGITEIHVAEGTYLPNKNSKQEKSFDIDFELTIKGGFSPVNGITDESSRDFFAYPTILSGDLNNSSIPDAGDSHTIITLTGNNIELNGFIIQNGFADDALDTTLPAIGRSGAGIYNNGDNLVVNCILKDNIADANEAGGDEAGVGGGLVSFGGNIEIVNTLFTSNTASANGGAISSEGGTVNLINCTIAENNANKGGGTHFYAGNINAVNSIFAENSGVNGNMNDDGGPGSGTASYSLFYNTTTGNNGNLPPNISGSNNITNSNPLYDANFYLATNSLAIDAGNNSAISETLDLAGNPRVFNGIVDMGAYETQETLSVEQYNNQQFSIYPNPVKNTLNINTQLSSFEYALYSLHGQKVMEGSSKTVLDVSTLSAGVYVLKLSSENKFESFKIIKD